MVFPVTTNLTGDFLGKAFVVCVIGGLGSVPGALVGGLVAGHHRELRRTVLRSAACAHRRLRADAVLAGGQADRADRHQGLRVMARWLHAICSFAVWVLGAGVNAAVGRATISCGSRSRSRCTTALALSWNFIGGFTGYPSFSTAAFFGLGCYAGALSQRAGIPMVLAWVIATVLVGAFAAGARRHHPPAARALFRDRLDRHGRGHRGWSSPRGAADRRRRRAERAADDRRPGCGRRDFL